MSLPNQPNLGELSQEQLMLGFERAYTTAPAYMTMLGCRGEALEALQTDLDIDGWSVLEKNATDNTSNPPGPSRYVLKPGADGGTAGSVVSCDEAEELRQLFDGCLNPECGLSEDEITQLAVRHKVLMNIGYFFPVSLEGAAAPTEQKRDALNSFYKDIYLDMPEPDRGISLSGSQPINELVIRFAHGFALLGLFDSLQRHDGGRISSEVARGGVARIIGNARLHPNKKFRPLGIPLGPETIQAAITDASRDYNRAHR